MQELKMLFFRVLGRLLSRFFSGIGNLLAGILKILRRNEMALGIIVVIGLIVGGIYLLLSVLNVNIVLGQPQAAAPAIAAVAPTAAPTAVPAPPPTVAPVLRNNAPDATEAFMQGQVSFDGGKAWDAIGAELHTALQSQGRDKAAFERDFQKLKTNGVQYETYQYIGGYKTTEGGSIHFYVLKFRDSDNKAREQAFTFRLGNDGKIASFN